MKYVEYVQTDGHCYFDTGLYPSNNTEVRATLTPTGASSSQWNVFFGAQSFDDSDDTFQLRKNAYDNKWAPRVGNKSNQEAGNNFSTGTTYDIVLNGTALTTNTNVYSIGNTRTFSCPYTMYIGCINNPSWIPNGDSTGGNLPGRAQKAKYGRFQVYENGVLAGDFRPAVDNNQIGFYDDVTQTFKANLGTGTPVAGPDASSISATPSKTVLAATGETITIDIETENAWTATEPVFFTLSQTAGTGNATITLTATANTGATYRSGTVVVTDSATGDYVIVTIRQKYPTNGQPVYLGGDEITEIFLGGDSISEAYLGDVLVFSTGPFVGLKAIPSSLSFNSAVLVKTLKVKSSESWTMTLPSWITASTTTGGTGDTVVTLTATAESAATSGTIEVASANYSASTTASYALFTPVNYIHSQSMGNNTQLYITLPVNCTLNSRVRITGKGAGYNTGWIIIGNGLSDTRGDWRWFGINREMYFDINNNRININEFYSPFDYTAKEFDFTLSNHSWTAEYNGGSYSATGTVQNNVSQQPFILVLSVLWIKTVQIWEGETLVFDGTAAKVGNDYGLFDTLSGQLITTSDFTIVGEE